MKFRQHRGSFEESMKTVVEVKNFNELIQSATIGLGLKQLVTRITFQCMDTRGDTRNGWARTYLVTVNEGQVGYCDGEF